MIYWILGTAAYLMCGGLAVWVLSRNWHRQFGKLTRGDVAFFVCLVGFLGPLGLIIAVIVSIADAPSGTFWSKQIWPKP